jgi:sRNA-binding protein
MALMDHLKSYVQIAKRNYQNQRNHQNHQKKEKKENHQYAHSVEKNSQDHQNQNAKNAVLKFNSHISHMDLIHMAHHHMKENIHISHMDLMGHLQKLNAKVVVKNLNSLILLIMRDKSNLEMIKLIK